MASGISCYVNINIIIGKIINRSIECTLQVESEGAQAICQAHQSKPHYCQIATPACYYAILSAKP
jgi:hypothetical protein